MRLRVSIRIDLLLLVNLAVLLLLLLLMLQLVDEALQLGDVVVVDAGDEGACHDYAYVVLTLLVLHSLEQLGQIDALGEDILADEITLDLALHLIVEQPCLLGGCHEFCCFLVGHVFVGYVGGRLISESRPQHSGKSLSHFKRVY